MDQLGIVPALRQLSVEGDAAAASDGRRRRARVEGSEQLAPGSGARWLAELSGDQRYLRHVPFVIGQFIGLFGNSEGIWWLEIGFQGSRYIGPPVTAADVQMVGWVYPFVESLMSQVEQFRRYL